MPHRSHVPFNTAALRALTSAVALGAITLTALTGCQTDTTRAPASPGPDPLVSGAYPQITMAQGLIGLIVQGRPVVQPSVPHSPLRVTVPIRSVQDGPTRVQYQFTWLDHVGRPIGESGWKYELVPPRMERFFESNALDTRAVDWRLEIKIAS